MSDNEFQADIQHWMTMWDKMQDSDIHPEPEVPHYSPPESNDPADVYYAYNDAELLQEEKTPNPVYPDSVGPDHTTTPPVWADEKITDEIEKMKDRLFDLENQMASKMGGGQKWVEKAHVSEDKKIKSKIDSLRKEIEKVSSRLGVENEPSPWEIKRDEGAQ